MWRKVRGASRPRGPHAGVALPYLKNTAWILNLSRARGHVTSSGVLMPKPIRTERTINKVHHMNRKPPTWGPTNGLMMTTRGGRGLQGNSSAVTIWTLCSVALSCGGCLCVPFVVCYLLLCSLYHEAQTARRDSWAFIILVK